MVCDAVLQDFAGHAFDAKMLCNGDLVSAIGVFECRFKELFFGFEVVKESCFGDVLSLCHVANGKSPESEL